MGVIKADFNHGINGKKNVEKTDDTPFFLIALVFDHIKPLGTHHNCNGDGKKDKKTFGIKNRIKRNWNQNQRANNTLFGVFTRIEKMNMGDNFVETSDRKIQRFLKDIF